MLHITQYLDIVSLSAGKDSMLVFHKAEHKESRVLLIADVKNSVHGKLPEKFLILLAIKQRQDKVKASCQCPEGLLLEHISNYVTSSLSKYCRASLALLLSTFDVYFTACNVKL